MPPPDGLSARPKQRPLSSKRHETGDLHTSDAVSTLCHLVADLFVVVFCFVGVHDPVFTASALSCPISADRDRSSSKGKMVKSTLISLALKRTKTSIPAL